MTISPSSKHLIAYTRALPDVTPQSFLAHYGGEARTFWQRGQYASAYAGVGSAVTLRAQGSDRFARLRAQVGEVFSGHQHDSSAPADVRPRFFGGAAFEADGADNRLWGGFGSAQMILPRYLLTRSGGYSWLTICDMSVSENRVDTAHLDAEFAAVVERIQQECDESPISTPLKLHELTDHVAWRDMVAEGVGKIRAGELRKIVLSRALEAEMNHPINAVAALVALEKSYPTAFRFMIEPEAGQVFFGASPELLARLEDGTLYTHALAGSAPRGEMPSDDDRIAAELLASSKDRHEHALVVDWLRAILTPISRTLDIPHQPVVTKLRNIQHLFTPVQAQLRDKTHLLDVIERLHPTPALGGDPQHESRAAIREIEPMPRGWYGAPVGWIDAHGDGEFAVAIRSALACESHVRFFAGAGIVADSDPDREWEETKIKFKPMLAALGVEYDVQVDAQERVLPQLEGVLP